MSTTVFLDGHVFDGSRHVPGAAVAIRDQRILAVGDRDQVRARAGSDAQEVDAAGGLVLPGFEDAHMHPMVGGLERRTVEMSGLSTVEDYLAAINRHAEEHTAGWVRGGGWSVGAFGPRGPTAARLDEVVPDRPVFLPSTDHHDAWVNTRALEIAGITAQTPDPPDGWIERDAEGRPTGTLREAAMALVGDHLETTREEYADALREAQTYLHSWGITAWHDALIGGYAGIDDPTQAYLELIAAGELTAHVRASQWWDRHRGTEQVDELVAERERLSVHGLDAGSVKLMMDGIAETFTATVTEPYTGDFHCACGDSGLPFLSAEQVHEAVTALDAAGFSCHFHAIGDQAVHDALDAVESARLANGFADRRHQVAHLQLVRPEDRGRFRTLGVIANLQGMWVDRQTPAVTLYEPHLGEQRASWQYPCADIVAAGARIAGGSDWPVNAPEPIGAVHALVNRRAWSASGDPADPLVPEQAITLREALGAYTQGSAWASFRDDAGVLQVGARADVVVLDRDPFAGPPEEIGAAEVAGTWAGGQQVYERS